MKKGPSKKVKALKKLAESDIKIPEIFADPTFDVTFKMLFGNDAHKDILISLINSLLGFQGEKEIIAVEINTNELPISKFSSDRGESGVTSAVDILCTNKGKHKIAIEMQGQRTKYFLAREQEYMAKLISNQVKEGEGKLYNEKVLETYIIVIGKANIFFGSTALKDQKLFELDIMPLVMQTYEVVPFNKMFWKFFELPKFKESSNYKSMSKDSPLKEQFLEFLLDCSEKEEEPDRDEIIKKAYEVMKVAKWDGDKKALYWKQRANEQDFLATQESLKDEMFEKGKIKGKIEGKIEGKIKGEIKGEISKVKALMEEGVPQEKIITKLKFLTQAKIFDKLASNLRYIQNHINDSDSFICDALGLVENLS